MCLYRVDRVETRLLKWNILRGFFASPLSEPTCSTPCTFTVEKPLMYALLLEMEEGGGGDLKVKYLAVAFSLNVNQRRGNYTRIE